MSMAHAPAPERPPTPPHHPTHGVRLSQDEVKNIILDAIPDHEVGVVEQLPSGKSFNNRIYFTTLSSKSSPDEDLLNTGVVLKIPGWNFGVDKIENEVISLLLLEAHCPHVPTPRILAWSEGGGVVRRIHRVNGCLSSTWEKIDDDLYTTIGTASSRGLWILMTRLPGLALQRSRLETSDIDPIMQQLARYMSQWRKIPAPVPQIGNLRFVSLQEEKPAIADIESRSLAGLQITIHGLLIGSAPSPMNSPREYYEAKVHSELAILKDNEIFASNRLSLLPLIQELLHDILPHIILSRRENVHLAVSTFTHYDFSPRNILVSSSPSNVLKISGIVDFEFAGFFPYEEEFTNTCIASEGDWPPQAWNSFTSHLAALGVNVPKGKSWSQACALYRIIENIAPWQLREGGVKGEELEVALQQARSTVEENVLILKQA